jgi:hypothetical protein
MVAFLVEEEDSREEGNLWEETPLPSSLCLHGGDVLRLRQGVGRQKRGAIGMAAARVALAGDLSGSPSGLLTNL